VQELLLAAFGFVIVIYSHLLVIAMSAFTPQQAVSLASALIHMRSETLTSISKTTGIRAPNLSVWLRGKSQVISEARIAKLLYHLGVQGTELRKDLVHSWMLRGGLENLSTVLTALVAEPQRNSTRTYIDESEGFTQQRLLLIPHSDGGHIAIRLAVEPGVGQSPNVATENLGFPKELLIPCEFSDLPDDPLELGKYLADCSGSKAGLSEEQEEEIDFLFLPDFSNQSDWSKPLSGINWLRAEIQRCIHTGVSYDELARLIAAGCPRQKT
jgi:hypothetical protein